MVCTRTWEPLYEATGVAAGGFSPGARSKKPQYRANDKRAAGKKLTARRKAYFLNSFKNKKVRRTIVLVRRTFSSTQIRIQRLTR